jgi:aldehyde dehydrogenase (NAD+)
MAEISKLEAMRRYFDTGATKGYAFRRQQLQKLKKAILQHEEALYESLFADLRKSREETWVTETGMVISEINTALKGLRGWMEPERVSTNLVNMPSGSKILREPLGVVLIISPWNYPFQLLINPLIGAIAAGNCVVLKPSEFAPATDAVMKQIIEAVFLPEYILYVQGEGQQVIPQMLTSFKFNHIFYTGSTAVGKIIYQQAAANLVPVTLELGGKSPCVVESDANIKVSARRIAMTKFSNSGQMCVAPDYVLVHSSKKDELVTALKESCIKFFGERAIESYNYGRMINTRQFDRVKGYLEQGKILFGGDSDRDSLYIGPTLIDEVKMSSPVMNDEIFGPVLPIISFNTKEEAMQIINKHPDPLAFYLFTSSRKKEEEWMSAVSFGGGCINNASWHLTNHNLPFGGRGFSGMGNYHGKYSFETFTHRKAIMRTPTWFDPAMKYPPFKGKLGLFKKIIS